MRWGFVRSFETCDSTVSPCATEITKSGFTSQFEDPSKTKISNAEVPKLIFPAQIHSHQAKTAVKQMAGANQLPKTNVGSGIVDLGFL
jgi:ATP-dependent helicase YprA (DUF1998 family)